MQRVPNSELGTFRVEHRAPVEDDFASILKGVGGFGKNIAGSLLLFAIVGALIYLLTKSIAAAGVIASALFLLSLHSNIQFFRGITRKRKLTSDGQAVEVIHVDTARVVEIGQRGDDGPALVFFAESRQALLLVGQWMLDYQPFPVSKFTVSQWRATKEPIRIELIGSSIASLESEVFIKNEYRYGRVELFQATPETLQMDLELAFGDKSKREHSRLD